MLEMSAFESLYGGQFTSSTQLIKPNYLVILPTDTAPQFLKKLTPLFNMLLSENTCKTIPTGYNNVFVKCVTYLNPYWVATT